MPRVVWRRMSDSDEDERSQRSQTQGRKKRKDKDDDERSYMSQSQKSQGRRKSGMSQTQNSTQFDDDLSEIVGSQSRSQNVIPEDELNRLMGHVVRYILVADRTRHPIQRQNIQKNILNNSKQYRFIMDYVKLTLQKVCYF